MPLRSACTRMFRVGKMSMNLSHKQVLHLTTNLKAVAAKENSAVGSSQSPTIFCACKPPLCSTFLLTKHSCVCSFWMSCFFLNTTSFVTEKKKEKQLVARLNFVLIYVCTTQKPVCSIVHTKQNTKLICTYSSLQIRLKRLISAPYYKLCVTTLDVWPEVPFDAKNYKKKCDALIGRGMVNER